MTLNIDYDNLPEIRVEKDGVWYLCKPFLAVVKGGKNIIYTTADGTEIKREPVHRYKQRMLRQMGK